MLMPFLVLGMLTAIGLALVTRLLPGWFGGGELHWIYIGEHGMLGI